MTRGARSGTSHCPNGQTGDAHAGRAVQWNRSIMEVRHART